MNNNDKINLSKVPQVTLVFWVVKILATTLGETAGDAVSMTMNLGYAVSTFIFFGIFLIAVMAQVRSNKFHPFLYWAVIVATTTAGTTMADYADRSLGIGYEGGSLILFAMVVIVLAAWRFTMGSVSVEHISSKKIESFYWLTILFSNTLGTALGDWLSDTPGIGYERGAMVFLVALGFVAGAYFFTRLSHTILFWVAFILTRPLGATVGDLLTKPMDNGGLDLSRINSSVAIAVIMIIGILLSPKTAGSHSSDKNLIN